MNEVKIIPVIYTHKIFETLRFYNILGFDYDYDYHDDPKSWSMLKWGENEVLVTNPDPYDRGSQHQTCLCIEVNSLEEYRERIAMITYNERYISDIKHNPEMNQHEFFLYDDNRNMIKFIKRAK